MHWRRRIVIVSALLLAGGVFYGNFTRNRLERPGRTYRCPGCNVILITFDALRADHLGVYGYAKDVSPNIDSFARRSAVFRRSLSQSGSTISSVPSIHTSKFPHADKLLHDGVLRSAERTVAEILNEAGYRTMAVIAHEYARCRWGACQGFDVVDEEYAAPEAAAQTRVRIMRLLQRHLAEPFFLWVHFRHPHGPYRPAKAIFDELYDHRVPGPTFYSAFPPGTSFDAKRKRLVKHYGLTLGERVETYHLNGALRRVTPTVVRQLVAMYDGNIREVDREFGALMDHVTEIGLADNTVVILSADHAESLGEHGIFGHNFLWYRMLHTPLLVRVPAAPPAVFDYPVMNVDIVPTILELVDVEVSDRIRGVSLFDDDRGGYVQYAEYAASQTVVRGDFKLIVGRGKHSGASLFDIVADPAETVDVASSYPELVHELSALATRIGAESVATDPAAPDTMVREKLRSLGYIK